MSELPEPSRITADRIGDRRLQALYRYWSECCDESGPPPREAIDPVDMPRETLPYVVLTERVDGPQATRLRYRIVGSAIAEAAGRDPTWEYLDETLPRAHGYCEHVHALYGLLVHHVRPLYSESSYFTNEQVGANRRCTRRLMTPLVDGARVTHVLTAQVFDIAEGVHHKPFLASDGFEPGPIALVDPE